MGLSQPLKAMREAGLSGTGLLIWLLCGVFFLYEFLLRTLVGTFQHPIMYELELTPVGFSVISSTAYILVYGLMQIPVGIIVDRYGLRRTLSFACLLCAVSTVGFAYTHSSTMAVFFRVLTGLGSSFGLICLFVAVYDWLPNSRAAFFIGASQFMGTMGPMFAAGPVEMAAQTTNMDWRTFFLVFGFIGFILTFFIVLKVRNQSSAERGGFQLLVIDEPVLLSLKRLILQRQVWIIAIYCSCVYFFLEYFSENNGKYFLQMKGFSLQTASNMLSVSWLGYAFGCPLLGYLSDRFARRRPVMITAAVCIIVSLFGILYLSLGTMLTTVLFFLLGVGVSGQGVGFATIAEQCRDSYRAAGLGFNNAVISLVAALNAPIIGYFLGHITQGAEPTLQDYQTVFVIPLLMGVVALLLSVFCIRETYTKSVRLPFVLRH